MTQNRVNRAPIEDRITTVWELAVKGRTVRQIAAELGISRATAGQDLKAAIAEIPPQERHDLRMLALDRYNKWLVLIHDAVEGGADLDKVLPVAITIQQSMARLFNLNDENAEQHRTSGTMMHLGDVPLEIAAIVKEAKERAAADMRAEEERIRNGEMQ